LGLCRRAYLPRVLEYVALRKYADSDIEYKDRPSGTRMQIWANLGKFRPRLFCSNVDN